MRYRIKMVVGAMLCAFLLAACGGGPADVAEDFTTYLASGEITKAKELSTETTAELLELAAGLGGLDIDPDFDFELIDEKIDGNRASITYRNGADGKVETIELVKLDGKWKVHADKD